MTTSRTYKGRTISLTENFRFAFTVEDGATEEVARSFEEAMKRIDEHGATIIKASKASKAAPLSLDVINARNGRTTITGIHVRLKKILGKHRPSGDKADYGDYGAVYPYTPAVQAALDRMRTLQELVAAIDRAMPDLISARRGQRFGTTVDGDEYAAMVKKLKEEYAAKLEQANANEGALLDAIEASKGK